MIGIRRPRPGLWWSLASIFLVGLLLLATRELIPVKAGWDRFNESIKDLARDLGIAFIVSSLVAGLFELYRSLHHQIQSMRDVIDAVMADKLTKEVWFELEDLIDKKSVLRKELRIRLEASRDGALQSHEARLRVELEYVLIGIGRKPQAIKLAHDLDYQLANSLAKLPRFERITVVRMTEDAFDTASEEKVFDECDLNQSNRNGRFELDLKPLAGKDYLRVRIVREELAHIPGSYNFYTPEFAKGLRVLVAQCPENVRTEVWVRPQGEGKHLVRTGNEWWTEELILPGQGVEIKFLPTSNGA